MQVSDFDPVCFSAIMSAAQGPVASDTVIAFDVVEFNVGGAYDVETFTFTAPTDGIYEIVLKVRYQAATIADQDVLGATLDIAGAGGPNIRQTASGNGVDQDAMLVTMRFLNAGDTVKALTRTSGASKTVVANVAPYPASLFQVRRVCSPDVTTFVGV